MEEITCDWIRLATLNQAEDELWQHRHTHKSSSWNEENGQNPDKH